MKRAAILSLLPLVAACASGSAPPVPPVASLPVLPPRHVRTVPSVDPSGEWELRWDRGLAGWSPSVFDGRLVVAREGDGWTAKLHFDQSGAAFTFSSLHVFGDRMVVRFAAPTERGPAEMELDARVTGGRLVGELRWGDIPWTPLGGKRYVLPELKRGAVDRSLPAVDVASTGASAEALQTLVAHAREEHSSAIVLVKDGKIAFEAYHEGYDGRPLVAMSASKSIVSLAIGMLIGDKKLTLDTRMDALFPEWRNKGARSGITVRQLLTHTSGLDPVRASFEDKKTIRERSLEAKLVFPPGSRFQYDNDAVDFLAVVVRQAAGEPLDQYLEERLFKKLDIVGAHWMKDAAGDPRASGELALRPVDLAKLGQLMLDGGKWQGEQLVPADWVARSVEAGQRFDGRSGMLWWREGSFAYVVNDAILAQWHDDGLDDRALRAARALRGHKYARLADYRAALESALGADALKQIDAAGAHGNHVPFFGAVADGPVRGFSARGWRGQYLVVYPQSRVVAVRMRATEPSDDEAGSGERHGYPAFAHDVAQVW